MTKQMRATETKGKVGERFREDLRPLEKVWQRDMEPREGKEHTAKWKEENGDQGKERERENQSEKNNG